MPRCLCSNGWLSSGFGYILPKENRGCRLSRRHRAKAESWEKGSGVRILAKHLIPWTYLYAYSSGYAPPADLTSRAHVQNSSVFATVIMLLRCSLALHGCEPEVSVHPKTGARFFGVRLGARLRDCNIEFVFNITTRGRVRTWPCGAEWGAAVQPSSATSARCVRQAAVDERPLAFPTIFSLHENPGNPKKILKKSNSEVEWACSMS